MAMDTNGDRHVPDDQFDVLVILSQPRNERLLIEWLTSGEVANCTVHRPDDPTGTIEEEPFDLCILDPPALKRHATMLRARRERVSPAYLPCLLVVPEKSGTQPTNRSVWAQLGDDEDVVDELIRTPIRKGELANRLDILLRTRSMSVELGTREEQYRRLVDLTPESIVLIEEGTIIYVNEAGQQLLGTPPDRQQSATAKTEPAGDLVGRPIEEFVDAEDRDRLTELIATIEAEGSADSFVELQIESLAGRTAECEVNGVQVTYGGSLTTQLVIRDLTDRRKREQQLRLFGRAINEANQGISIADAEQPDQPLVYINDAFERITGYAAGEVLGRNCRFLQGEETDPETVAEIGAAIDAERPVSVEIRNYRKNGTPFWNQLDITPVKDETGTVTHYIGLQRDITARKEREIELERYETIIQTAGDPIFVLDNDYRFVSVNDALTELLKEPRDELIGTDANRYLVPAALDQLQEALGAFERDPTTNRTVEIPIMTAGNETRYTQISLAPLPTQQEDELYRGIVGVVRDVTERRRRQQRLAVLERVLRHNLRNEMNVVMGFAEEINRMTDDIDILEANDRIHAAARRLLELADEVREFRDIVETRTTELTSADLESAVEQAVDAIRDEYPEAEITVELSDAEPVYAATSPDLIVTELLENAIIHNAAATPRVAVTFGRDTETEWVELRVADNGDGIPDEVRELIEHGEETPLEHLSGLGLWLVRWTVEQSGGDIQFEDNDQGGTTVVVRFHTAPSRELPAEGNTITE